MCGTCGNNGCSSCGAFEVPEGPAGIDGWSPVFAVVADGATRQVLQLVNWTGGTSPNPGHIGEYVSTTGFTATIGAAANIRGSNGTNFYKFVKFFTTAIAPVTFTISVAELTACSAIPAPCTVGSANPFVDLHIQVWNQPTAISNWQLIQESEQAISINYTTGLISVTIATAIGDFRVVVLA